MPLGPLIDCFYCVYAERIQHDLVGDYFAQCPKVRKVVWLLNAAPLNKCKHFTRATSSEMADRVLTP